MIINASIPFWRQIARIVFLTFFLVCIGAISISFLFPAQPPLKFDLNLLDIFIVFILLGPLIESILVIISVFVLSLIVKNKILISFLCGLLLAILHGMSEIALSLIVFFPFVVYAYAYQIWQERGANRAFWLILLSHAIHNSIVISLASIFRATYQYSN